MSTAKRSHQRPADTGPVSSLPPAKRAKISKDAERPSTLASLTDERKRAGKTIDAKLTNGVSKGRVSTVEEHIPSNPSRNVNNNGHTTEEEDQDEESEDLSSGEDPSSDGESLAEGEDEPMTNGTVHHKSTRQSSDDEMEDVVDGEDGDEEEDAATLNGRAISNGVDQSRDKDDAEDVTATTGPSFGELLEQAQPDVINVSASYADTDTDKALVPASDSRVLKIPSGNSVGTVLAQALRTNDKELLESCLQTKDVTSIKSTIQRLQSPQVATLMQKLAERLHKRPGRAGPLMVWIQWSLISHGNYLAAQPALVKQLRSLRQVVHERASSLQHLVTLKGKLDMLGAQVELRQAMRGKRNQDSESDDDDADVIYVEGNDDGFSSSSEEDDGTSLPQRTIKAAADTLNGEVEMDGDIPLINGVDGDAALESLNNSEIDESDLETEARFIDDEAEESDGGSMSSEEEQSASGSDQEDEMEDESGSSSDEAPPARRAPPAKRTSLRRSR